MKLASGMVWTGLEKSFLVGIGFVQGVVLARLLSPRDFGLVAMLGIFISIGQILSESGLGSALVAMMPGAANARELRRRAFRWTLAASLAAYAVLVAVSPAVAAFFSEPVLVPLAGVLGVSMVANAACVADNARLNHERRFRELSIVNCVSELVAFAVGVALAWTGCGVWSVAAVGVAGASARFAALRIATRRGGQDAGGEAVPFSRLLHFGWRLAASGLLGTLYWHAYSMVIGRMFSPSAVGLFARARRWALLPGDVVDDSVARISLVELSRERMNGEARLRVRAWRFLALNELLLLPLLAVLYVWGEEIVGLVLGAQWVECVPFLRILAVGAAFRPLSGMAENVLKASGRADVVLKANTASLAAGALCLAAGAAWGGLAGICWAMTAGHVVSAAVFSACALHRRESAAVADAQCLTELDATEILRSKKASAAMGTR